MQVSGARSRSGNQSGRNVGDNPPPDSRLENTLAEPSPKTADYHKSSRAGAGLPVPCRAPRVRRADPRLPGLPRAKRSINAA